MSQHEIWNELGNLYFISGSYDEAIAAYTRAIRLDNNFGKPYSNMALVYARKGQPEVAIGLFQKSIQISKDSKEKALAWSRLGDLFRQRKDYNRALDAYQKACQFDLAVDEEQKPVVQVEETPFKEKCVENETNNSAIDEQVEIDPAQLPIEEVDETFSNWVVAEQPWTPYNPAEHGPELPADTVQESLSNTTATPEITDDVQVDDEATGGGGEVLPVPEPEKLMAGTWVALADSTFTGSAAIKEEQETPELSPQPKETDPNTAILNPVNEDSNYGHTGELDTSEPEAKESAPVPENPAADVPSETTLSPTYPAVTTAHPDVVEYVGAIGAQAGSNPANDNSDTRHALLRGQRGTPPNRIARGGGPGVEVDIARYKNLLQMNPHNALAWDALGNLYKSNGRYEEAISAYQEAISLDSSKAIIYHHLGLAYAVEGRDEDAIRTFERVVELEPGHGLAHASLAGYYRRMGLDALANEHVGHARAAFTEESEYNRACLEAISGNADQAIELLRTAMEKKQTDPEWMLRDPDLDFIRSNPRFQVLYNDFAMAECI